MTTKDLGMVTAYAYAVMGGYEGTEAEFEALLGNIATDLEEIENLTVIANTLPEGSSATASYADGVLTLGIPKGDTGATGAGATATVGTTTTGDPGTNASVTNSGTAKDAVFNFTIPRGDTGNGIESIYLTGTSGAVKTYTILFTDGNTTTFDVTDGEVTNATLTAVLADYAKTDGAYESMTVGNAEQLISSVTVNDKVPYNFRTSGGSIDIGNREVDKLVGGTVAWNQLVPTNGATSETKNGITFTNNGDGSWTINGTATADVSKLVQSLASAYVQGHKILYLCDNFGYREWGFIPNGSSSPDAYSTASRIIGVASNPVIAVLNGVTVNNITIHPMVIDLTQMFGSTIADYVYSLEQATAGAGVAWFKKLFNKPYYAYNAGELLSVSGLQSHDMTGFNQWDEETELGGISSTNGSTYEDNTKLRSKNFCEVLPNTNYYFEKPTSALDIFFYDAEKNFVSVTYTANRVITTPSNAHYVKIVLPTAYGTTYNHDICINLSWDGERDGEYEAYKKWTYPLDSDLELRGIPKLDSANNLYYDGDTYESDGTVTRKYGIVDLGTLNYTYNPSYGFITQGLSSVIKNASGYTENGNLICSKYITYNYNDITAGTTDKCIGVSGGNYGYVVISDSLYTNAETFKTAMSGVYLVYELATPTTEEADPYQNPQIVDDFGTEEYVDERTVAIPVGHDTEYMNNLKAKLEMAPDSPDGDGDYVVRQTNGENSYVPLMKELPNAPSEDGTYTLKCTVSSGTATLGWEREE